MTAKSNVRTDNEDNKFVNDADGNVAVNTVTTISTSLNSPVIVLPAGTEDGTELGDKFLYVNNVKNQILATHDRDQAIYYEDFGTKQQRVTRIDYTSDTFPGIIARKEIVYTLVGSRYRRDNIRWSII